jgi:hypothetical protein
MSDPTYLVPSRQLALMVKKLCVHHGLSSVSKTLGHSPVVIASCAAGLRVTSVALRDIESSFQETTKKLVRSRAHKCPFCLGICVRQEKSLLATKGEPDPRPVLD